MTTWAIGDVHGCLETLERLLRRIDYSPRTDTLWFTGDLVNRGPDSVGVLRRVIDLPRVRCVLGNHDLSILAIAAGLRKQRADDASAEIWTQPDADELVDWIRHRPLIAAADGHILVHAGLSPEWSVARATQLARKVEAKLRRDDWRAFLASVFPDGGKPKPSTKSGRALVAMTHIRCVDAAGNPDKTYTGPLASVPKRLRPWFQDRHDDETVVFGHWAAIGFARGPRWVALDSGCSWGRALTAYSLDSGAVVQEPFAD